MKMGGFDMMALMNSASQGEAKPKYEAKTLPIDAIIPNPANQMQKQEQISAPAADAPPTQTQMEHNPDGNTAEQEKHADFPYTTESPEAYAIVAVYEELKALRESYQGAAQRAIAVADNTQGAENFTAAAEYVETLMEIVAQEMADIEAEEGAT